ncbi:Glycine betaine-binding protein OpuAC precursor [Azoarcus sp. Aa7]|nr:Glycine betaine-binding protein OpuAC precursor [Azoarcus sp. Aa7]
MKNMVNLVAAASLGLAVFASNAAASVEPANCRDVRFADVGWTDIAATTALASTLLEGLGYRPKTTIASVPITFAGIKKKQIDVFLGYWSPSMTPMIEPFVKTGDVKVLETPNLTGAKYTLAVPKYVAEAGLKSFADIARFADKLDRKIYGIEPGNDGNALIDKMLKENTFGLKGFEMVESSEAGMLLSVDRAIRQKKWIVFLGWEPHPMNVKFDLTYLEGGDEVFGPNYGEAKVYTVVPPDYLNRCPNVGRLVTNLTFSTEMENRMMIPIIEKKNPATAIKTWLKENPAKLDNWLAGVKTADGGDGLAAVKAYLQR